MQIIDFGNQSYWAIPEWMMRRKKHLLQEDVCLIGDFHMSSGVKFQPCKCVSRARWLLNIIAALFSSGSRKQEFNDVQCHDIWNDCSNCFWILKWLQIGWPIRWSKLSQNHPWRKLVTYWVTWFLAKSEEAHGIPQPSSRVFRLAKHCSWLKSLPGRCRRFKVSTRGVATGRGKPLVITGCSVPQQDGR